MENASVHPAVAPAVPEGTSRLRTTATAAHSIQEIDHAVDVFERVGRQLGLLS
jgi:glycine C-acetyltransferase